MTKVDAVEKELMAHDQIISNLRATIQEAQSHMKKVYDLHHKDCEFEEGALGLFKASTISASINFNEKELEVSPKILWPISSS